MAGRAEPRVSVAINNYNYARYLGEAIASALAQSRPPDEVVVVDDGSTDGSREVIASYGDAVVPVLRSNGGQAAAMNTGFEASRGDVVIFLDSDDRLLPNAVERAVAGLRSGDVGRAGWDVRLIDACGNLAGHRSFDDAPDGDIRDRLREEGPQGLVFSCPPTSANSWWREALREVFPIPEASWRISADTYLLAAVPLSHPVAHLHEVLTEYRLHGANGSLPAFDDRVRRDTTNFDLACDLIAGPDRHADAARWKRGSWIHRVADTAGDIAAHVPDGSRFVLIDDGELAMDRLGQRIVVPCTDEDGIYGGPPPDDETAVAELQRARRAGAFGVVVAWPSFWWLAHYRALADYVSSATSLLVANENVEIYAFADGGARR